jgi:hypothetical protein
MSDNNVISPFKVVEFPDTAVDVCERLRNLANKIEEGKYKTVKFIALALVDSSNSIAVFAYGTVSDLEVTGAFSRASVLVGRCIEDIESRDDETPDAAS